MEQTKEQLIADLYGLRACLSLISQKIDEKQEFEQKIEDEEKRYEEIKQLLLDKKTILRKIKS